MAQGGEDREYGVVAGSPAASFDFGDADEALIEAANPSRKTIVRPRGGSRKGVPNKASELMRLTYRRLGFADPMIAAGHLVTMGPVGIAKLVQEVAAACNLDDFKVDPHFVMSEYRKAVEGVLPYLHGKAPMQTDDGKQSLPMLVLGDLERGAAALAHQRAEGAMAIDDDVAFAMREHARNQHFMGVEPDASHGEPSHDGRQDADETD